MKKELFATDKKGGVKHWTVETDGANIIVRHGKFGGKMQEKVTVAKGKNIGRANETTPEQQAISEAESKYNKQLDKCYRPSVEEAAEVGGALPMLAHNYLDSGHRIIYPCDVSPKLDGVRCIAEVDGDVVKMTSRGGKSYDCPDQIRRELVQVSKRSGQTLFDGEIYKHGYQLQDIVSAIKKPNTNTRHLQYWIFDIPVEDTPWTERKAVLDEVNTYAREFVKVVRCITVTNEPSAKVFLDRYRAEGYEGLMLRNLRGVYTFNHRSEHLQKWKVMQDAEGKVIDVEKDKNGEGVLHVLMRGYKDRVFKCKMRGTHEERLYDAQKKLVGQWITYYYQQLTNDGLPQFPVGAIVRDCDKDGNPIV